MNDRPMRTLFLATFVLATVLAACSGPRGVATITPPPEDDSSVVDVADYETFDAEPFRDTPPRSAVSVIHDVPEALMQNRADAGVVQIVDGFRVQVFSSLDRNDAVVAEEEVTRWWQGLSDQIKSDYGIGSELSIYNNFKQPLYRVRVGDFTQRADAERLMSLMARRFTTVFVVPDRVTIRR